MTVPQEEGFRPAVKVARIWEATKKNGRPPTQTEEWDVPLLSWQERGVKGASKSPAERFAQWKARCLGGGSTRHADLRHTDLKDAEARLEQASRDLKAGAIDEATYQRETDICIKIIRACQD